MDLFIGVAMKSFSEFLKVARTSSGLSQRDVADRLGYKTPQFISNWERGLSYPPTEAIKTLSKLYKVELITFYNMILAARMEMIKTELRAELFGDDASPSVDKSPRIKAKRSGKKEKTVGLR